MGRAKAFLPFRGGTFLSTLAATLGAFCSPVIAVFGFEGEAAALRVPDGVMPAINANYRLGMLTSLQAGLRALDLNSFDRVLFTPVDHPAVSADTVALLVRTGASIAIPRFNGKRGHPVVVRTGIAREFLTEPAGAKVRDAIDRHADDIFYVDVDDAGTRDDVDDPSVYEALLAREAVRL